MDIKQTIKKEETNMIVILHIVIIIAIYAMPFWLDWKLIIVYGLLNYLQVEMLGGCVISQLQFKDKHEGFYKHYINKFFPNNKITDRELSIALDYCLPIILTVLGYLIQNHII
jgi:hypothetical protein